MTAACLLAATALALQAAEPAVSTAARPSAWAEPVAAAGAPNLHRVTPFLYRSAQPTREGFKNLEALGVRTVIDLRAYHSDRREAKGTGLRLVELDIRTWKVAEADVVEVLRRLRRREDGPFLVHCQHGADRTGVMMAMFRMVEQGWSKEEALREMRGGGYGFHPVWKNIVRLVERADVEGLRRQVDAAAR